MAKQSTGMETLNIHICETRIASKKIILYLLFDQLTDPAKKALLKFCVRQSMFSILFGFSLKGSPFIAPDFIAGVKMLLTMLKYFIEVLLPIILSFRRK